jgi:purine-binding chemotaxis protein CheW
MFEAKEKAAEEIDTQRNKYLTFMIDDDQMALNICYVIEIINVQPISALPEAPIFVKGVINLRGRIIPVIDMHFKLCRKPLEYTDRTCIIVLEVNEVTVGIIVDCVNEVLDIDAENIESPTTMTSRNGNRFLKGIGKIGESIILIMDCENFIETDEIRDIK